MQKAYHYGTTFGGRIGDIGRIRLPARHGVRTVTAHEHSEDHRGHPAALKSNEKIIPCPF